MALGNLGESAREQVPRVVKLLKDPDPDVRATAVKILGSMVEVAGEQVPRIGDLLEDPITDVRGLAAEALVNMGRAGHVDTKLAPRLGELLKDPNKDVRREAATALAFMGEAARESVPHLVDLLRDPEVSGVPAAALGKLGEVAWPQIPRLIELMDDPAPEVRRVAVATLANLGEAAREAVPRVVELLEDPDPLVRGTAARALGAMGAREQAPRLGELLKDRDELVRDDAAEALAKLGAREQIPLIIGVLPEKSVVFGNTAAWQALVAMTPLEFQDVAALLGVMGKEPAERPKWLARAHAVGGGDPQVERVLRWLGWRMSSQLPTEKEFSLEQARATLRDFAQLWPHTEQYPALREDLAQQISQVAILERGRWTKCGCSTAPAPREQPAQPPADAGRARPGGPRLHRPQALAEDVRLELGSARGLLAAAHLLLPAPPTGSGLLLLEPLGAQASGLRLRGRASHLGALPAPPPARALPHPVARGCRPGTLPCRNLLRPLQVRVLSTGRREPLLAALPRLRGQVVLEGASGLGKSMYIKYLLRTSKDLAVYLPAERCKEGVIQAIQAKLEGHARDTSFLQSIIYSGALDIYIDGLNEVAADTRTRIVQFVEPKFHGNILLATQRMEWTPPATASRYELQPLTEEQVAQFLRSREPLLGEGARLQGAAYYQTCEHFLSLALSPGQPEELRRAMLEVLSNPMDLTVVAQMLSTGHPPDLFRLQQQQYELMARDYHQVHLTEFPLHSFSEEAYRMRLEDRGAIAEERFGKELLRLESFKMVVSRQWTDPDGKKRREWHFRHDKLQDFFIAQTFLGPANARITEHVEDPRFRGVYFLLAKLLEPESAMELQDHLVEHAAETHDHTVSDEFVNLLKARQRAEQVQAPPPVV